MQHSQSSIREIFYIDLTGAERPADVQDCLCRELPLPDCYGKNLDALYDVLTSTGAGWDLIFCRCARLRAGQPAYFKTLQRLCDEAGVRARFFDS